jgi:hypothetical protein
MVLLTVMRVLGLHCRPVQPAAGGLQSVEMVGKKPPLVAVMDMETEEMVQAER